MSRRHRHERAESRSTLARSEHGFALMLALFVAMIASAAMMLGAAALKVEYDETRRQAVRIRLDALLDAAFAETLADPSLRGLVRRPFADGWLESTVDRRPGGRASVYARAALGNQLRDARIEVVITVTGPRVLSWMNQ